MGQQRSTEMKLMEVQFRAWLHRTRMPGYNLTLQIYNLDGFPSYARNQPQRGRSASASRTPEETSSPLGGGRDLHTRLAIGDRWTSKGVPR